MTTATDQQTSTRDTVHARLLEGARPRDIERELGISGAAVAKNIAALRRDGYIVAPPARAQILQPMTDRDGGELGVVSDQLDPFPERLWFCKRLRNFVQWDRPPQVAGWLTAVPIPKVINPDERGPHGHTDWLLVVVGGDPDLVRSWVHMRGQRISERHIADRLGPIGCSPVTRLVALGLSHLTGLEVVLERDSNGER